MANEPRKRKRSEAKEPVEQSIPIDEQAGGQLGEITAAISVCSDKVRFNELETSEVRLTN
jgi:hypothetical protein